MSNEHAYSHFIQDQWVEELTAMPKVIDLGSPQAGSGGSLVDSLTALVNRRGLVQEMKGGGE